VERFDSGLITTGTIMTNSAQIINFPEQEQIQGREYVKADTDNGYYRVANELGLALCRTQLSDREGRLVQAVMMKTFGFNKSMDWICNGQLNDITGIKQTHISDIKKGLVARNILIVEGKRIGINPVVSEWVLGKNQATTPKQGNKKPPLNRVATTPKQGKPTPKQGKKTPQTGNHNKQDTITKDNITKDSKFSVELPSWLSAELWTEFVVMRKTIKKPLTDNAAKRMITKLGKYHDKGIDAAAQLTNSIDNFYSDVYEPKNFQVKPFKSKLTAENFDSKDYGETVLPEWMPNDQGDQS
jgi:phage replication O-like protein O